jgi:DNA (cytosine-5)-methyltransferase 1
MLLNVSKSLYGLLQETVYDIEVEDDHSFTVFNTIAHNCQDISVAGKQAGLDMNSGTRSGLLWECQKVIDAKKPKYLLMENVKNLVGKKHKHNFDKWLEWLEEFGYTNYWQILNAKDYGIPQNRERVFCVSILGEHEPYIFPEKQELTIRLKDVLEDKVDEKFYLSEERVAQLIWK